MIQFPRQILWPQATLLERHENLARHAGLEELYIKRDDTNGLGFGGNKVRQLEYYLGDAIAKNADTILMTGAVQSNFVRTAAAACAMLGLGCHVQLEDRVANTSSEYRKSGNVLLDQLFGAVMHTYPHGEDEEGADRQLGMLANQLRSEGRAPYIVHMHPDHPPLGALGYVDCAKELAEQLVELESKIDVILVPSGSGNTHGGLLYGLRALGIDIPVHGICVRRAGADQQPRLVRRTEQIAQLLETDNPVDPGDVIVNDEFLAPGYGIAGELAREAMMLAARHGGLVLDPVYSAKTFAGLVHWARGNPDGRAVFIHTGGGPSIFGYRSLIDEMMAE